METNHSLPPPKPVTEVWRPELVRLPRLTLARRVFREFMRWLVKLVVWVLIDVKVEGMENFPKRGPALMVINHLGDADTAVLFASIPYTADALGKIELYDLPFLGKLMDLYGIIWLHRGQADIRAVRAVLAGFAEGRVIAMAPEGRESVTGALEEGTNGAAFLAYKADVPILPIALTGTENLNVYGHMKRWRRARATVTVGKMFRLETQGKARAAKSQRSFGELSRSGRSEAVRDGTRQIMEKLAELLPEEYRGAYS
ncbi:MAG: lysophospholipid acyltransferase family protein [Chloroflexota bacterium]